MGAKKNLSVAMAVLACTVASTALTIPNASASHVLRNSCFTYQGGGLTGRNMGVRNARSLFNRMFNRLGRSCAQLERLTKIISETPLSAPSSLMGACFAQGYTETLFNELDDAYTRCGDRCFSAGSDIGRISAQGYCAASAAVGGLDDPGFISQPALPFCGQNLVMGCKTEYVQQATVVIPGCSAFTEGQFEVTFDNTVRQDCFVPTDVPVRDSLAFVFGSSSVDEIF